MSDDIAKAWTAHLVADWLLQNDWMAQNKADLRHPAAYIHSGIHLLALLRVLSIPTAVVVAISHLLIDTRTPLRWWQNRLGQATEANPFRDHVWIWEDQALHLIILAVATLQEPHR